MVNSLKVLDSASKGANSSLKKWVVSSCTVNVDATVYFKKFEGCFFFFFCRNCEMGVITFDLTLYATEALLFQHRLGGRGHISSQ